MYKVPIHVNWDWNTLFTCLLRYLELHGLNTVGIFRVGSNKKRVDKVSALLVF